MDGRARNYPNGMGGARRPSNESRRPPGAPGGPPSTASSSPAPSGMSRAERFDDERRRITESLFAKLDDAGQLQESYITHIRVQEDSSYPQSPPPPTSNTGNKKARIIIISVRSTGRVKLHKARENANGTFSIGKSWPMEDLTAIENYVHMNPINEEEAQRKSWAGEKGFTVTISKPYYWEAGTPKEKEFFIGSMVKIYNKYTRGDFPTLTGFSVSELNSLTNGQPHLASAEARPQFATSGKNGGGMPSPGPSPNLSSMSSPRPTPPGPGPAPPSMKRRPDGPMSPPEDARAPMDRPEQGRNKFFNPNPGTADARRPEERPRRPPGARPGTGDASRAPPPFSPVLSSSPGQSPIPGGPPGRPGPPPGMRLRPSQENMSLRNKQSMDQMPPPLPTQRLTPKSSRADFSVRPKTPESFNTSNMAPSPSPGRPSQAEDARSQRSQRSVEEQPALDGPGLGIAAEQRRPNGFSSRRDPSPRGLRPGTAQSNASSNFARNEDPPPEEPPQRRRPFMEARPSQTSQRSAASQGSDARTEFHTPLQSPQPPMPIPPRRRPQDLSERSKGAPVDEPPSLRGGVNEETRETPPLATKDLPPSSSSLPQTTQSSEQKAAQDPISPAGEEPKPTDSPVSPLEEKENEVAHRPGLGPMIKKNLGRAEAANAFRKAATAAGAFKPRAGGAAAKLFAKPKTSDEPDGVSGVFVPQRPAPKEEVEVKVDLETKPLPTPDRSSRDRPTVDTESVPAVTVSSPLEPTPAVAAPPELEERLVSRSPSPERPAAKAEAEAEVRRKKRRSNQQIMNISKLGIDPATLDDQGLEFEKLLSEFGWGSSELSARSMETLEADIRREIARVEAGSWLNHLEQKDDRVEAVEKMLDRAIAECDELEGLLTLYNVELSSLNDDITFIEAQSQGLQVQTANQRLLQHELQQLVDTISITPDQLEPLRRAPIGKVNGLSAIENSLVLLYKALVTIDPAFVAGSRSSTVEDLNKIASSAGFGNSELATMQALQEKKDRYLSEGASFLDRLKKHMEITFGAAFMETKDALKNGDQTAMPSTKNNIDAHDVGRSTLWMLSPVVLFAKEIDRRSWDELLRMYQTQAGQLYQTEVRDNILSWKRFARRPTGEEQDLLFTTQEKEPESLSGAARKLTVKRSQTLARGLRSASGDKEGKANKVQDGRLYAFDVFAKILDDIGPVLLTEQNFVTEFFHATSTDSVDFPEAVKMAPPENRRGPDLWLRKQFEADRAMAKRVAEVMEDIFSFWPTEIQNLVDWAVNADPLQGVGILCAVDRKLLEIEDSNQDFLTRNLQKIHERLTGLFTRFVDEQIRAIEDTKVKIKKRKGVIGFMKTFPHFAIAIENMLPASDVGEQLEIRRMVDDAYQKINKAMFESLKVIAKESPAVMATQGQGDPEDKEALNYHILLIENMNHYMEEVDGRTDSVLLDWKTRAQEEMKEHMDLYVDAVIRRPLGKLLEFIESTETFLSAPGASPQSVSQRSSHSRSVFKKLVNSHDAKEIRKGIDALKKRVDKHFGDADDPSISRDLVFKVLKECEKKYTEVYDRTVRISQDVYTGEVEMDWGTNEVAAAFRR